MTSLAARLRGIVTHTLVKSAAVFLGAPFVLPVLTRALRWNDFRLLRKVLASGRTWHTEFLFDQDRDRTLDALYADGAKAIRALIASDPQRFRELLRSEDGALLKDALFHDGAAGRLRPLLEADDYAVLKSLYATDPGVINALLMADGAKRLKAFLDADDRKALKSLYGSGSQSLRALLLDDGAKRLKALLDADESAALKSLYGPGSKALRSLLLDDDAKRLKTLLGTDGAEVLKSLYGTGSQTLKSLMLDDDAKRLRVILGEDEYAFLKSMFSPGSRALKDILLDDGAKRLQRILFADDFAVLDLLFRGAGSGALRHLLLMDESRLAKEALSANNSKALYSLLFENALIDDVVRLSRTRAHVHFAEAWSQLQPHVESGAAGMEQRIEQQRRLLLSTDKIWEHLTLAITGDGLARLRDGAMKFGDHGALWTLIHEILINEDYYAELQTKEPRILDCGAHFGMGLYYFVAQYPGARITAFEPDPGNFEVLSENASRNGWKGVELLPYALSEEDGTRTLYRSEKFSMASSLSDRRKHFGESLESTEVQCRRLSPYLREPIDFLKLDIEGEEDRVLEECAGVLGNVRYLFCEYHQGQGLAGERLPKILQLLTDRGFDVQIGKSHGFQARSKHRPMTFVDGTYSAVIYARNRNWPPAGSIARKT